MKKSFYSRKRYVKFGIASSSYVGICGLIILVSLFSCSKKQEQSAVLSSQTAQFITVNPTKLPAPIKAKYIDPDSVASPLMVPLKGRPKVMPAHANVQPIGRPKRIEVPKDLRVVTLGTDVPLPVIIPAKGKVVPVLQPKPIAVKDFRTKNAAIYNIQFLSEEQGVYTTAKAILEDSRGHLWFGSFGYIARYDGQNFFVYTEKEGFRKDALEIIEDSKGNIWFAGRGGICYFDGTKVVHFKEEIESMDQQPFRSPFEDSKGNIWFANGIKGVYRYDGQQFTIFNEEQKLSNDGRKEKGYYSDNRIVDITEDSKGNIWWATQGIGVLRYDGQQITHFTEKEGLIHNYISSILEDDEGQLWFGSGGQGTKGKGVSRYNPREGINGSFYNFSMEEGLSDNRINDLTKDNTGNIWIATYGNGLNQYDGQNFIHITPDEGLSFSSILSVMTDRKDNIWVGTNGGGISRFQPKSFSHFTEKQGLSKNWITPITEDQKGNIWMGTLYGGVIKYDGTDFTHFTEKEGLLQNVVNAILEDSRGNLWFAYRDKGISRFDGKNFYHYTAEQGLSAYFFWDLHEDEQGNIWVACGWDGGMTRINPNNGQITHFIGNPIHGIGGSTIMEDSQHNLWFGGRGLVAKFEAAKDELIFSYNIDPIEKEWVEFLVEDKQKNVWLGTTSSFTQIQKSGQEIKNDLPRLTIGNGLPNTNIASIIIDNSQNIWVGGSDNALAVLNNGLDLFGQSDASWLHYHKEDGLLSNYFSNGSICLDSKNRLWLGSVNGITQLNLNSFQFPTEAPQNLSLSHIDLQGQFIDYRNLNNNDYRNTLSFGEATNQSYDSIAAFHNYPTTLNLPHDVNHLTFHVAAMDWSAPHKIQYSYQMEGVDKIWSEPSAETKADYRSLPYGAHTFKVKAIGEAQVWSNPISYTFTIQPPWWHTWWAYGLYALLAFGASGWYIQSLRRKIQQKQAQLERELYLNRELQELNKANSRFVPHDFLQILGKTSLKELKLGDQIATKMTILFADIRDYTTLSEKITPEENFKFINAFLGRMGPIIQENGGFICQYMGDGIMALFKDKHELAIQAAIEMQQAIQRYNRQRFAQNRQAIRIGVGLNTGQLMLGVIGDKNRYESSVISDAVNTASRMEGLTKVFGSGVIVSEKTLQELLDDFPSSNNLKPDKKGKLLDSEKEKLLDNEDLSSNIAYRFLGKIKVKGKEKAVKIFDCYGGDSERIRQLKDQTSANFEAALQFYYDQKFGKAADLFKVVYKKFPEDIATEYYLTKAVKYVIDGVDVDWNGVETIINK